MATSNETLIEIVQSVCTNGTAAEHRGQLTLTIPKQDLLEVARELRDNPRTQFNFLIDVTAIDRMRPRDRFEVVYFLRSLPHGGMVRLKVMVDESDLLCPSVVEVWESADWYERETFDMYGIRFEGHPDLRRFYMPEDFVDPATGEPLYPLRKDFPLMGVPGALPLPPMPTPIGNN